MLRNKIFNFLVRHIAEELGIRAEYRKGEGFELFFENERIEEIFDAADDFLDRTGCRAVKFKVCDVAVIYKNEQKLQDVIEIWRQDFCKEQIVPSTVC